VSRLRSTGIRFKDSFLPRCKQSPHRL